jgi:hypothetical protein
MPVLIARTRYDTGASPEELPEIEDRISEPLLLNPYRVQRDLQISILCNKEMKKMDTL